MYHHSPVSYEYYMHTMKAQSSSVTTKKFLVLGVHNDFSYLDFLCIITGKPNGVDKYIVYELWNAF